MITNRWRTGFLASGLLAMVVGVAACGDDDNPQGPPPPPPDEIATNLTDPAAVIAAHAKALTKKNYTAYEALLDDQFEFYPLEQDAEDFPWLKGDSWSRTQGFGLILNMFDPAFAGSENPVDSIEATLTILTQRPLDGGRIELLCTMQGRVLTSAYYGWTFDTRMLIELVPRDGFLRILKMTEVSAVREGGLRVDELLGIDQEPLSMKRNRSRSWIMVALLAPARVARSLTILSLLLVACSLAACSDDDNPESPSLPSEPAEVIAAHEEALRNRDYDAYEALLDDQFEFVPLEHDAEDFPWLEGSSWAKTEELNIIGNMFDPAFAGGENPVQVIEADVTILSQQSLSEGRTELTCTLEGRVLTAANDGWSFDTRLIFEVVLREGNLRIFKITEVDAVLRSVDSVEGISWARLKSLYLDAPPPGLQRDSIDKTIQYFAYVWRHKLYNEYDQVLHDQFEFVPLERDAEDFPWLEGSSWPKTTELDLASHMFDPGFSGEVSPIDVIEMTLTELSRQTLPGNIVQVNCSQQGRVLTDANDGWSFDTRTLLEIVPDPDEPGLFQIKKQTEVEAFLRSVEDSSWGSIKGLFR